MYSSVIDAGYNSFRLVVYEVFQNGTFRILGSVKQFVRIGEGLEEGGYISEEKIKNAEGAFLTFRTLLEKKKIEDVRVIATSAFRYASNGKEVAERLSKLIGKEIRIISGEEEGRYSAIGILNTLPISDGIVFEMGGGSIEFTEIIAGNINKVFHLQLGALKLYKLPEKEIRKRIRDELSTLSLKSSKTLVGSGGNVRALAKFDQKLSSFPSRSIHGYSLPSKQLSKYASVLYNLDPEERAALPGISKERAVTIHSAAIILDEICKYFNNENLIVSSFGMREGVITEGKKLNRLNWLEEIAYSHALEPPLDILNEIQKLVKKIHSLYVATAGYLALVFKLAGYLDPYEACYRFIKNSVLPGFTLNEAVLIGLICKSITRKVKKKEMKAIAGEVNKHEISEFGKVVEEIVDSYAAGVRL